MELLGRIRRHNLSVGEYYKDIQSIFKPYRNKKEIRDMLEVVRYCQIFDSFGVN